MGFDRSKEMLKMNPFKICPKCTHTWKAKDDFLQDKAVCLVGFQAYFKDTKPGYYLFNHIPTWQSKWMIFCRCIVDPCLKKSNLETPHAKIIAEMSRIWIYAR
jgi:hypothetical protein